MRKVTGGLPAFIDEVHLPVPGFPDLPDSFFKDIQVFGINGGIKPFQAWKQLPIVQKIPDFAAHCQFLRFYRFVAR